MFEPTETAAIIRLLGSNVVDFADLGANIGWYSLIAGHLLRGRGQVHSFEPDPDNFAKLESNINRNQLENVTINRCAVSDEAGTQLLYRSPDHNLGDHQLYDAGEGRVAVPVEVRTLDSYSGISRARPLVVKIDTQGSELRILRGMSALLAGHPHEVLILSEFWPKGLVANRSSPQEMIELLSSAGFSPLIIFPPRNTLLPVTWEFLSQLTTGDIAPETGGFVDLILFRQRDGLMRALS